MKKYVRPRILQTYRKHVRNKKSKSWINRKPTAWHAIRSAFRYFNQKGI